MSKFGKTPEPSPTCRAASVSILLIAALFLLPSCFILRFGGKDYNNPRYQIIGRGGSTSAQMARFLVLQNPKVNRAFADYLARLYVKECDRESINHDVAFSQMCLETGFLKFGGAVKANQNNYGGLGAVNRHTAGESFPSVMVGVRAHIQHLKAYASAESARRPHVDKRVKYVKSGSSPTIFELSGRWSVDRRYGKKIKGLIDRLYASF